MRTLLLFWTINEGRCQGRVVDASKARRVVHAGCGGMLSKRCHGSVEYIHARKQNMSDQ